MANKWNQQEQGAKRKRTNQGTRGATRTQPAASNPNKNRKSTDTNRNSGRTAAAKPAPKAAPKQTKSKTVYYSNKNKGVKGAGQAAANAIAKNPRAQAAAKDTAGRARVRLANQTGAQRFVTGRDIPTVMNKPKTFQQTVTPLEQVKADSLTGPRYWTSRATVPSKPLTAEQQKKKNQQTAKQSGFNARARKQTLSSHDQKLSQGKQFQIQQAKQRYDEAKAKGDRAGMEKAHREAERLRNTSGYSGGATGNERIAPKLNQDDYNRLNASGRLAMTQARMTRDRATTEDEIARADRRIEEILNAPGYQNNRLSAAETGKGWSYGPDGRRMWNGTKEQNRADAAPGLAALRAVGEGAAGGLLYAGQTASRATRDKFERENIDKWIADEANYNQAKSDLEFIRSYKEQFGVVPEGYNEMQAQIAYNNAVQARAQLQRIRGNVDSLYFDPTVAERLGLPTTRDETLGERLLRQAAEDQAKATEGMNGVERFATNALISTGQSVPGMALGLIPGVGPALGLGVLGAQAGGSRAYDLRQQGVTAEDAYRAGFISGGIEALTEKLPLENFAQIVKGKGGKSALRNVLEQAGLEGSEEAVSYVGNYIADVAQQNPDAHFSWLELLENAGMGAIGGAAFGVAGGILSPGHAVSPMGAQSEEIQEQARSAAAQVEAVQDAETQIRTVAAQRLREDAQAYNEMVKAGVWSDAEQAMVKESLDQRYAEIAGQGTAQASAAGQTPLTQVFEDGMQRNRGRAERAPVSSVPTPLAVNETPVSVNPVEQAEQMTAEALRATDAEMARRDAVAQLQAETPPITYERSGLPPTSFLGTAIDARREARARAEAEAQVRRDQETARQNRMAAEQQTTTNGPAEISTTIRRNEQAQVQHPTSRLEGLASTFGESGAASLRTIGGKMVTGQGAFVRDFTDVYNQVLGGRSESQVSRPAGMSDANYFAAVTAAQNDRQTGWDLDILKASKAAGRNVNAGVDWRDQYVRQMGRKTARTVDGLAKALGVKVVFAEKGSILTAGGTAANAEITGNVVRIEKGNPNPVRMLIGHELTHRMQDVSPESYRAFRDYAMSVPGSTEALERTVSLYQRAGAFRAQDNARQMAMDEVTADFAGSLLENSEQLQEFIRRNYENRTMLEVIRDFFRDLAAKLTGRERAQADEAVRLLEEAIKGASARVKETGKAENGNKNTAQEGGVKKMFSLSAPVEETDTLVALHNLNETKMGKALDLGGFPMPSIAVTRKDIPHTNFGDISLVMSRDTIDPRKSRKNTVYSADAWTPTFPSIEYEADSKAAKRLRDKYYELYREHGGDVTRPLYDAGAVDAGNELNRWGGEAGLIEHYRDDIGMMKLYLLDTGKTVPEDVTEEHVERMSDGEIQLNNYIVEALGKDFFNDIYEYKKMEIGPDRIGTRRNWWAKNEERFNRAYAEFLASTIPNTSVDEALGWLAEEPPGKQLRFAEGIATYLERGPEKRTTTINRAKTNEAIRKAADSDGYDKWLHGLFDGLEKSSGIYNNKDIFTPSGNRRTFKQTHYPVTLDNIVKAMAGQNGGSTKNVSGFHGIKTLRAGTAKRFRNIKEMHELEGRLQHLTPEEADKISNALSDRMTEIIGAIYDKSSHGSSDNYFIAMDSIGETLVEVADSQNYTIDNIVKTFGKYQYKVDNELAQDIKELLFDVSQMPVNIFEAKPERAVRFDEVLAAVVPSDMDAGLRSRMEEAGMRLIDYERDNEQSRIDAVNSVEGARFSITPQADADYLSAVERGDMETAQRMVDEAAKAALASGKTFTLVDDDGITSYKLHRGPAPKKTMIVYKTFNVDENGAVTATYAGVDQPMPKGVWLDAVAQEYVVGADGNKYIPGKTGTAPKLAGLRAPSYYGFPQYSSWLSYRPAFHASTVPAPLQMRINDPVTKKKTALPHNKLIFKVEVSADRNYQEEAKTAAKAETARRRKYWQENQEYREAKREADLAAAEKRAKKNGEDFDREAWLRKYDTKGVKVVPVARDQLDRIPEMGLYTYSNQGEAWVLAGSFRILGVVSEDEVRRVNAEHGIPNSGKTEMNWIGGYHPEEFGLGDLVLNGDEKPAVGDPRYQQLKLADPVTYDDNGNVIPLSERFNAETGDIRYSIGTEGYDRARLMRENQQLKEKLDYWRGQVKKSDRTKADPKEVQKLANSLRTDYSTEMDAGEITQRLQAIYDGIGKDWTYDRAYEEAGKLAREMIEQAAETDDYLYNENEPLRKFFKDTPLVVTPELKRAIPDYNEWRKAQFGKLRLQSGDQTNIDQVFQEAAAQWPEWFSEEVSTNSLDQLERIEDVLDGIYRRNEVNPFGDDIAGPAGYLTTQIMDSFWDVPSIKKTFADRAEERLGREVTRRLDMKERYENALQKVREQRDRKLREQSEKYLTAKRKRSQKQKERELRAKIQRHVKKLSTKLRTPTDTQHIPEDLIPTVRTALESINLASKDMKDTKRTQAFEALRKMYQEMDTNGSEVVIDPDLLPNISDIIGFADTPIANLGMEDLNTIWNTVKAIENSISTFNKALGRAKFETISQPAFGIRDYLRGRKDRGDYRGPIRAFDKLMNFGMLTPEQFFSRLGQDGKDIFKMLRSAQDHHITIMQNAQEWANKLIKGSRVKQLEKKMETFDFDGQSVTLSTAQIMSLYELMKRQQAIDHVMVGGVRPESVKRGIKERTPSEPWRLTQDQIGEVVGSLTEEEVKLADEMQEYMEKVLAELGNEASMEVYGYRKFTEKHYFPISVDKNQTQSDVKNDAVSGTIAGWGSARPVKPNANNAVILRSIFDVFADHTTEMANYAAWLAPMENLNRIFNFRYKNEAGDLEGGVKTMLERAFGKNGPSYWKQLQEDLNNGVHGRNDNPFQTLIGAYKGSAIGANIRVIAQQPTAILRALDEINPADFVAGVALSKPGKFNNVVMKYAPIAVWKNWGYFTADTGRQMRNVLFNDDSGVQKLNNFLMQGAGTADSVAWTHIWNAVEVETRRKRKDLEPGSEAFYEVVAERFGDIIDRTQVVDGILQRSQIMRSPDNLTKMATSFMAEPTKVYNMMTGALYDVRNATGAERSKAMRKLARTSVALLASFVANAAAQSLVDALRDDDKDEEYWQKFLQAFWGGEGESRGEKIKDAILNGNVEAAFNPATYIPWAKDIVSLTQGFNVSRMDMDTISRVVKEIGNTMRAMNGEGKLTKQNAILRLSVEMARFLGIPASNLKRDIMSGMWTFYNETHNYRQLYEMERFLYDPTASNNQKEFVKILFAAQQAGDQDAYQHIRQDLIDSGIPEDKLDKKLSTMMRDEMSEGGKMEEQYNRVYDAYEEIMKASPGYQGLDAEQQEKVQTSLANYAKAKAIAEASGEEFATEDNEMNAIQKAEAAGVDPVTWKSFRVYTASLKGTGKIKEPAEAWLNKNGITGAQYDYCMEHYS